MKLLYPEEHINCLNYRNEDDSPIHIISLSEGEEWKTKTVNNMILLLTKGKVELNFNYGKSYIVENGKALAVSIHNYVNVRAKVPSSLIVFQLYDKIQLCDRYSLDKFMLEPKDSLISDSDVTDSLFNYLDIDERLDGYLMLLEDYISSGLKCIYFMQIKIQEFFFLLRAFYSKKELYTFLKPLIITNSSFSDFVYNNYKKVRTVKELADMANYSLSGFQKHFKKIFGVSAYQWLKTQRSKSIYHELNCSERALKDISNEYGFSSPSHFNDFCKIQFGQTPGDIRRNK